MREMKDRLFMFYLRLLSKELVCRQDLIDSQGLFEGSGYKEVLGYQHCLAKYIKKKLKGESRKKADELMRDIAASKEPLENFWERFEPLYTEALCVGLIHISDTDTTSRGLL